MTSVLLDANVAIKSAELGAFESILKLRHIKIHIVPQVRDQIKYYSKKDRDVKFDLPKYLNSGRIQLIDCYGEDIMAIMNLLPDPRLIHSGELESLAILKKFSDSEFLFCTADQAAIKALVFLDLADNGISLEALLQKSGLSRRVPGDYSQKRFEVYLQKARIEKVQSQRL